MTTSESTANIAAALAKAQRTMKGAPKDSSNPHFSSKYADLESIREASQEPLAANEIAVVQSPFTDGNLVAMVTKLIHSSGEWILSDPLQVQARDAGPQAVSSCITYLRRIQLAAVTGIAPADADDDAEAAEGRKAGQSKAAAVKARDIQSSRVPSPVYAGGVGTAPAFANTGTIGPLLVSVDPAIVRPGRVVTPEEMRVREDGAVIILEVRPGFKEYGKDTYELVTAQGTVFGMKKPEVIQIATEACQKVLPVFFPEKIGPKGKPYTDAIQWAPPSKPAPTLLESLDAEIAARDAAAGKDLPC